MDSDNIAILIWDAENRIVKITKNDGGIVEYGYDYGSRRIMKTTAASTERYIYNGWNLCARYQSTTAGAAFTLQTLYTWGKDLSGSMQGAGGVGGLLAVIDSGATGDPVFYPTYDGNGNVSEYLDSSGNMQAHYEYDAYGNIVYQNGAKANDFVHRFSTKYLDNETGLYYYGYRYYDPVTGRWPSRDPIGERGGPNWFKYQSISSELGVDSLLLRSILPSPFTSENWTDNLYAFVRNGASNYVDSLGLDIYKINRKLGAKPGSGNTARSPANPLTHTYIVVEHEDGSYDTYSWGNSADTEGWNKNEPEDREGYEEAKKEGKAHKVKDGHDKDSAVDEAYKKGLNDPDDRHPNGIVRNNCKTEADELLREAGVDPWGGTPNPLDTP